ncbi:RNA methyltransferase [Maridesulfovibrio hydrothermalis]|uniref:tRNA (cytidine/uridine-2'-O-)-methyltransferase TrmJ n=1 Tax=Maridesulfovibrio hydrothermalis AM13 = DSM 14728 TaxID=1121451 RepID=L0R7N2_9BACT|nr:TrmJ/YjtD family RNA methyltransferase [Maridesulfovibrio hydrothermalis]CCO22749.1 RNA methyltransferase, TrmH family, group 1 [Maridesulfovibrio hydrothermalis AM13 = DSM 14728]
MLSNLSIVLFGTKYPENIGSSARAMTNMGCSNLALVNPASWDMEKAMPLATVKGRDVVEKAVMADNLSEALKGHAKVYGTTARTGGWRKGVLTPASAAPLIIEQLRAGEKVAVVFGPEDRGLTNDETQLCSRLINIPTSSDNSSLNLSQAVLIILYECFRNSLDKPYTPAGPPDERSTSFEEQEILAANLQETLLEIDFLKADNSDYWMMPVRRFLSRFDLKRNEFNLLMGICRQIKWIAGKADKN